MKYNKFSSYVTLIRHKILDNSLMRQYDADCVGCSAEGHVSHILSSRLSSRPMGWSKVGVDQMTRLRVFVANGGNVYDIFMQKKKEEIKEEKKIKVDREIIRKRKYNASHETIGNITILNMGKRTWISQLLKSIRDA